MRKKLLYACVHSGTNVVPHSLSSLPLLAHLSRQGLSTVRRRTRPTDRPTDQKLNPKLLGVQVWQQSWTWAIEAEAEAEAKDYMRNKLKWLPTCSVLLTCIIVCSVQCAVCTLHMSFKPLWRRKSLAQQPNRKRGGRSNVFLCVYNTHTHIQMAQ